MVSLSGHFDGSVFVPDEPVDLPVGRGVRIVIEDEPATPEPVNPRDAIFGSCRGMFKVAEDFDEPLEVFAEYRA